MVTLLPIVQLASLIGVFGLSAFVALVNAGFAATALAMGRARAVALIATLALIAGTSIWGANGWPPIA